MEPTAIPVHMRSATVPNQFHETSLSPTFSGDLRRRMDALQVHRTQSGIHRFHTVQSGNDMNINSGDYNVDYGDNDDDDDGDAEMHDMSVSNSDSRSFHSYTNHFHIDLKQGKENHGVAIAEQVIRFIGHVGRNLTRIRLCDWEELAAGDYSRRRSQQQQQDHHHHHHHHNHEIISKIVDSCFQGLQELEIKSTSLPNQLISRIIRHCRNLRKLVIYRTAQDVQEPDSMDVEYDAFHCKGCSLGEIDAEWDLESCNGVGCNTYGHLSLTFPRSSPSHFPQRSEKSEQHGWLPHLKVFKFSERTNCADMDPFSKKLVKWMSIAAPQLQKLELDVPIELINDESTFPSIAHHCAQLESLALTFFGPPLNAHIVEHGMREILFHCRMLRHLYLHSDLISVSTLRAIVEYGKNIDTLGIYPVYIPNNVSNNINQLRQLSPMQHISDLKINTKMFDAETLDVFLSLLLTPSTQRLTLFHVDHLNSHVIENSIRLHGGSLTRIELKDCEDVDPVVLSIAHHCPRLSKLIIGGLGEEMDLADDTFHQLLANCSKLQHLDLPQEINFTSDMLMSIMKLQPPSLHKLKIWSTISHDLSSLCRRHITPLYSLHALKISATMTNDNIRVLCMMFPNLKQLHILDMDFEDSGRNNNATIRSLEHITRYCPNLTRFHLDLKSQADDNDFRLYINKSMREYPIDSDGDNGSALNWIGGGKNLNLYGYSALQVALPNYSHMLERLFSCVGKIQYHNVLDMLRERLSRHDSLRHKFSTADVKSVFHALLRIHVLNNHILGLNDEQRRMMKEEAWVAVSRLDNPRPLVEMVQEIIEIALQS